MDFELIFSIAGLVAMTGGVALLLSPLIPTWSDRIAGLICSDHQKATVTVSDLVHDIPGMRPLDAGELSNATAIEAFTAVLLQLNVRYRTRVALKLIGIDDDAV